MNENKRAILEAVAATEKELRPFDKPRDGVSYEDIDGEFDRADFGGLNTTAYIPPRLAELHQRDPPALEKVKDSGSEANAEYRLTEYGWETVNRDPP